MTNAGLTQKAFAELYGIPVSTLRKLEQGEASPPGYVIRLLAKTLPKNNPLLRTHSFIERECRLLQYVRNRSIVDLENTKKQDFSLYEQDISERHVRIPLLRDLYDRKIAMLASFQSGKDIWKEDSFRYKIAVTAH